MVDYSGALTKPFKDLGMLLIGIILSVIPIVNLLTMPGYMVRVVSRTIQKDDKLPSITDNIGGLIIDSLKAIAISIVYFIPVAIIGIVLFILTGGLGLLAAIATGAIFTGGAAMATLFGAVAIALLATMLIGVVVELFLLSAIINFAKSGNWRKAFDFGAAIKGALKGGFIAAFIIAMVIYLVVVSLVSMISPLLAMVVAFPLMVAISTMVAQGHEGL